MFKGWFDRKTQYILVGFIHLLLYTPHFEQLGPGSQLTDLHVAGAVHQVTRRQLYIQTHCILEQFLHHFILRLVTEL